MQPPSPPRPDEPGLPLLDAILARQSTATLGPPGPTDGQLAHLLTAAGTVPDHGQLRPYRFVVIRDDGRLAFGEALASSAREHKPDTSVEKLSAISQKALRSPTIIVPIYSPKPAKIEQWEQMATAACTGYALVLAAHAIGVGAAWKSVPFTRGQALADLLGMTPDEQMLGWVHLGTALEAHTRPREALDVTAVTMLLDGGPRRGFVPG